MDLQTLKNGTEIEIDPEGEIGQVAFQVELVTEALFGSEERETAESMCQM